MNDMESQAKYWHDMWDLLYDDRRKNTIEQLVLLYHVLEY